MKFKVTKEALWEKLESYGFHIDRHEKRWNRDIPDLVALEGEPVEEEALSATTSGCKNCVKHPEQCKNKTCKCHNFGVTKPQPIEEIDDKVKVQMNGQSYGLRVAQNAEIVDKLNELIRAHNK